MTIVWFEGGKFHRHDTKEEFDSRIEAFKYVAPRVKDYIKPKSRKRKSRSTKK